MRITKKKKTPKAARAVKLAERYAHRGFHSKPEVPENSMAAFRRAADRGFASEFDVHLLADGNLAVLHDEELERETGVKGRIENYDLSNLRKLRLEGTDEPIPALDEVLDLYEDTGIPLLIELKTAGGNYRELTERVCRRLDRYGGEFVIESFDPRVLMELRKIRPHIIRGQLVQDFIKRREGLPLYQAMLLSDLALLPFTKPDFIAFRFDDTKRRSWVSAMESRGMLKAAWTIRSREDYTAAVKEGCIPIFEQFDPDQK